ncbi:hypothetical protein K2Q08_03590 [Patescibacteria group bacterium]|nr:hypothetical protein [Patescibacteria group bacterium]
MLYSSSTTLEDHITQSLLQNPASIKELHEKVSSDGSVSLRAVYKVVTALIGSGVAVKVGKRVWINQQWVRSLRERLYSSVPPLSPGQRATYTFSSLEHLDIFWKSIAFQFEEHEKDGQIFFYNPHNFWAYIPQLKESEDAYYEHFAKSKKHAFFTVGGTTAADREFKRQYQNDFLQIDGRSIGSIDRRDHITVLGDFVITARLSPSLAKEIDGLYDSGKSIQELLPQILTAYRKNSSVKLTLEHDAAKSKKLQKLLSPNFVLNK